MSNRPEDDPIGHAAKFLLIFALIPVIFGAMTLFVPPEMTSRLAGWQRALPFVVAIFIALVGLGVQRRIATAAWAGIALFALGLVGLAIRALTTEGKRGGMFIVALLLIWPIKKLYDAITAMRGAQAGPPV